MPIKHKTTYAIVGTVYSETAGKEVHDVVRVFQTENIEDVVVCLDQFRNSPGWEGYKFSLYIKLQ